MQRFISQLLLGVLILTANILSAQFANGVTVTEKQLIDRTWHITNLKGSNPTLGAPGGVLQINGTGTGEVNSFVMEDGPSDDSEWTADERWFLIRNVTTGTYITSVGTAPGTAATLSPMLPEADNAIYRQMFRLVPTTPGAGWYKLRSRLSTTGDDLVLEVTPSGTLIFDSPKIDPSQEQKFCFNLQLPSNNAVRYIILGKSHGHFLSDNGNTDIGAPVVHNKYANASVIWNIKTAPNGYYFLYNELTQQYAYEDGNRVRMSSLTNTQAQWELIRDGNTFAFKNRSSGKLIATNGAAASGSEVELINSVGVGGHWTVSRIDQPELSAPGAALDMIEDAPENPDCAAYGVQFKRALAERVGLTPNEDYFPLIQSALAFTAGAAEVDRLLKKIDLGNPGHRIQLALIVRTYLIAELGLRPRNTWSLVEEMAVTEFENKIEAVRADYSERLLEAWDNHVSNYSNSGNWGLSQLLESVTAEGFQWPPTYVYATQNQEQQIIDFANFAKNINLYNPLIPQTVGGAAIGVAAGVMAGSSALAAALFASTTLSISQGVYALALGGGPVVVVATFAACAIAVKAMEVAELQSLINDIEEQAALNNQPVDIYSIISSHNRVDQLKLYTDLDYVMGAPVSNGFQYNYDDNLYFERFSAYASNKTIALGADGTYVLTPSEVGGVSINCPGLPVNEVLTRSNYNCSLLGNNTIKYIAYNAEYLDSVSVVIQVIDNLGPQLVCKPIVLPLNTSGTASITTNTIFQSGTDNCGVVNLESVSRANFDCSHLGNNTITLTANDSHGNTGTCSAQVVVTDNLAPTATCKTATVALNSTGTGTLNAAALFQSGADNCGVVNPQGLSKSTFTCADLGTNTVTLTVNDGHLNTATCTATVTVVDAIAPAVTCKPTTVLLDANGTGAINTTHVFQSGTDNCGIVNQQGVSKSAFSCADLGSSTVVLTVNDGHGNTGTCNATVTVSDISAPVITCSTTTIYLNATGNATLLPSQVEMTGTDNCGVINRVSVSPNTFNCSHIGIANPVTLTVNDGHSNTSTCTPTVKVLDNTAPAMACKNITVNLDASGNASITPAQINNGSYDNCSIASTTASTLYFNCAHIGNNTVTLTATDPSGNSATCNSIVTVKDVIAPVALCKNITVNLDANGAATVLASSVDNGSWDICNITSRTLAPYTFSCANTGINTATLSVTDPGGNTTTCTTQITVRDVTAPVAKCKNITTFLNAAGQSSITAASVNNGSTDPCGIAVQTINISQFNCSNISSPTAVTLTLKDVHNNQSSCLAYVTVKDATAPDAICENTTVWLNAQGKVTVYGAQLAAESDDNCAVWSYSPISKQYNNFNLGVNYLFVQVKDWSGNAATCISQVTVMPYNNVTGQTEDRGEAAQQSNQDLEVVLFPNPTAGDVRLQFELTEAQEAEITVTDMSGRTVGQYQTTGTAGENGMLISTAQIPSGLYVVTLRTAGKRVQQKLVVQKD